MHYPMITLPALNVWHIHRSLNTMEELSKNQN
ncbi:hypothetical protein AAZX31_12G028900 [Glycine max]